jgi:predicted TIM-barrel fold metal-dependent hydrolase
LADAEIDSDAKEKILHRNAAKIMGHRVPMP